MPLAAVASDDSEEQGDVIEVPAGDAIPVDDTAPAPAEPVPLAGRAAIDPPGDGIWAWVARLEGEVLTNEAVQSLEERAEARQSEEAVEDEIIAPDPGTDVYDDPVAAVTTDPLRLDEVDPSDFDVPVEVNSDVKRWMRYFLGRGRAHFERYLGRRAIYEPMMRARLREAGLPEDLVYLSLIESGFNAHALSHAGAAGLWQFMPATGRSYDLRVDWWVDDRRDPIKSTDAAIAFLSDLHRMFDGDWKLSWCAYNAGPGRVRRAMRAAGTDDFWALARGGHLPRETSNYPPKLMAAAILARNAERYGFDYEPQPALDVVPVEVEGAVTLDALADAAGIDVDTLKHLNPGLRRWATPAEGYRVNLPSPRAEAFVAALDELPDEAEVAYEHHVVRRGDTLGAIAQRYRVSMKALLRVNHLEDADRLVVGLSLLIPRPGGRAARAETASVPPSERPKHHTVVRGDTLSGVARTYGVSTAQLRSWNDVQGDVIHVGQALTLRPPAPGSGADTDEVVTYTVRPGDTLSGVAARYGVTVRDLKQWNRLPGATIRVGQILEVRQARWRTVTVVRGDSLGRIATREGCSVAELKAWNRMDSDVIHPGQQLRLRR